MAELDDQLKHALSEFVGAFNDLNWRKFVECFTEDATVFMAYTSVTTRTSVADAFLPLFERARMLPGPPYLNIAPEDLQVEVSREMAFATFHLRGLVGRPASEIGRRTAVFRYEHGDWKMCHLHVSSQSEVPIRETQA